MAIVSQLCISFPYVLHGLCEDYLTCDIAFNAVMPLSRASTHGRYSRIVGVTESLLQIICAKARDHHAHECDAYTYLVVLELTREEESLRKQG